MEKVWLDEYSVAVTNTGIVYNKKDKLRKMQIDKKGYLRLSVFRKSENKSKYMLVHRLVAFAFIPNPENKPYINHIDGNRSNNNLSNLEWCTNYENYIDSLARRTGNPIPKNLQWSTTHLLLSYANLN